MAAAKTFITKNTHTEVVVKVVADATNLNSTTSLPLSGFTLATETAVNPTMNIRGMTWTVNGSGSINVYRGGTAEANLVASLNGNGVIQQSQNFIADSDSNASDFTIVITTSGTLYLSLSKQSGYTSLNDYTQVGHG